MLWVGVCRRVGVCDGGKRYESLGVVTEIQVRLLHKEVYCTAQRIRCSQDLRIVAPL
jgi:hypothetical protein